MLTRRKNAQRAGGCPLGSGGANGFIGLVVKCSPLPSGDVLAFDEAPRFSDYYAACGMTDATRVDTSFDWRCVPLEAVPGRLL